MCNHSHSEFLCLFWHFLFKCFPVIIAAQALLRSSISAATQLYQRCYAALSALLRSSIGAATQLLLALLPRRISRGGSEKGKGAA